jgi:hypothetical protein
MYWLFPIRVGLVSVTLFALFSPASAATITVVARAYLQERGDPLTPEIHLYQQGSNKDFWPAGRAQTAPDIPAGWYELDVFQPGFKRFHQEVTVGGEQISIRVVLLVGVEANGHQLELEGRVIKAKDYVGVWVLAFPLAGSPSDIIEARVDGTGRFKLSSMAPGPCLLAVVRGDSVLHSQQVVISQENPELTIEVGEVR